MIDSWEKLKDKLDELKEKSGADLSRDEDLSIAVMNLISLEEHFFFTAQKTGKPEYQHLLRETREIRKEMLARLMPENEGETWCIAKHLLAASMRLMEVGTKQLTAENRVEAEKMFASAYKVYSLFWALRLKLLELKDLRVEQKPQPEGGWTTEEIVNRLVDCCKE